MKSGCSLFVQVVLALLVAIPAHAQSPLEIRLWPDGAPGSENWSVPESISGSAASGNRVVTNVSDPTVTVYLPDAELANGTAILIAPGGALRALAWDSEGVRVAQWLNSKGIAGIVLKYRTLQQGSGAGAPAAGMRGAPPAGMRGAPPSGRQGSPPVRQEIEIVNANANPAPDNSAVSEVLEMAVADAQEALTLIRLRASEWNINPDRVGIMGFSAGGGVAVGTALAADGVAYPNFLVSLYGPSLQDVIVPEYAPPLFIGVGANHFNVTSGVMALFDVWRKAGKPAEMHIYDGVSAGFGMNKRGLPVDSWTDRLHDWLLARELATP